jgi:hypothetical protein
MRQYDDDWYPHDTSYKPVPAFSEPEKVPVESEEEMSRKYASAERELLGYGIEVRITNFTEYENALWQLNKITYEQ